jgi:S-layer protein (TIGR01567 family)
LGLLPLHTFSYLKTSNRCGGISLRKPNIRWLAILIAISFMTYPITGVEIRGTDATEGKTWTADDFAGFYYDFDENLKTEELTTNITEYNILAEPNGVIYTTTSMVVDFEFEDWGRYNLMGFMGEPYFTGYIETLDTTDDVLFDKSDEENVLSDEHLMMILIDSDDESIIMPSSPLNLSDGYMLTIKYIDNSGMFLELTKNGVVVDSKILSPSRDGATMLDKTYYYKKDIGVSKGIITIAVHFKNALTIGNQTMATVNGVWQLSEIPIDVKVGSQYDKMTVQNVDADRISMNNKGNTITLAKNKVIPLMPGISIRTANADELRYYIFSEVPCEC